MTLLTPAPVRLMEPFITGSSRTKCNANQGDLERHARDFAERTGRLPSLTRRAGPGVSAIRSSRWSAWRWLSRSTPFRRGLALVALVAERASLRAAVLRVYRKRAVGIHARPWRGSGQDARRPHHPRRAFLRSQPRAPLP